MATYTVERFATTARTEGTGAAYTKNLGYIERDLGKHLAEATLADIERLRGRLRSKASGKWYAAILRMFYNRAANDAEEADVERRYRRFARELHWTRENVKARKGPDDILILPEVNRMIENAGSDRNRALLVVLWNTGQRIEAILSLDRNDLDSLSLPPKKNGEAGGAGYSVFFRKVKVQGQEHGSQIIVGVAHVALWLKNHPDPRPEAPLFCDASGLRLRMDGARDVVRNAAKRAGIAKRVHPHMFRGGRFTDYILGGISPPLAEARMGWAPGTKESAKYLALTQEDTFRALLKKEGYETPEKLAVEGIIPPPEKMKAVVPVVPKPGTVPLHGLFITVDGAKSAAEVAEAWREAMGPAILAMIEARAKELSETAKP
jgi:integrase